MKPIYYLIHSVSFGNTLVVTPTLRCINMLYKKNIIR